MKYEQVCYDLRKLCHVLHKPIDIWVRNVKYKQVCYDFRKLFFFSQLSKLTRPSKEVGASVDEVNAQWVGTNQPDNRVNSERRRSEFCRQQDGCIKWEEVTKGWIFNIILVFQSMDFPILVKKKNNIIWVGSRRCACLFNLVLLSHDSKTRLQGRSTFVTWPIFISPQWEFVLITKDFLLLNRPLKRINLQ